MRLAKLRQSLVEHELDAILITQPENRRYLSGFTGSAGVLLISGEAAMLATDFRYYEQAEKQAPDFELVKITAERKLKDLLPEMIERARARRLGFESAHLTVAQYEEWREATASSGVEWVATRNIVERLRAIKDEAEIELIRRAVALADAAFAHIVEFIRPGMTEKEVAWELEAFMRTHGAEKVAFDIIVGSGPNGAMPHARTGERCIRAGEPIVMDLGARVDGYHSDLTRTVVLGQPDDKFRQIYDLVLQAQLAAEKGVRPGMTNKEADRLARQIIEEAGYGEQFGHGLGHGVGLAVHERPTVSHAAPEEEPLQVGMVFTVEPGIYLPGWGGVRIEDMVLLREDGAEVLSAAPKETGVIPL